MAIHLLIGMAYGISVLWLPLSRAIGIPLAWGILKTAEKAALLFKQRRAIVRFSVPKSGHPAFLLISPMSRTVRPLTSFRTSAMAR